MIGSHMNYSKVLHTPDSEFTSTPKCLLSAPVLLCFYLNKFKTNTESKPALSAIFLGMTSKALANAVIANYYFP